MRIIDDISNFIFVKDKPQKADIIFIPGGSYPEIAEEAARLWHEGYSNIILPSGKYSVKRGYFHSRRCLMYYQIAYPQTEFIICPSQVNGITKDNWINSEEGIDKVMGEVSRCGGQFKDIFMSVFRANNI